MFQDKQIVDIRDQILSANKWIVEKNLIELTWGNVSLYNREQGLVCIKPSGIDLNQASTEDISCIRMDGTRVSGLKPSVDTPTHIRIYENFESVSSVVHTHSKYATIFAQAGMSIPCLGTTHADYFYGTVPCIPHPCESQIQQDYESNTGKVICDYFHENNIDPTQVQACLVDGHAPFVWGKDVKSALENAYVLEIVAEFAFKTLQLNPSASLSDSILDKHFLRKHGNSKYYGQ